MSEPFIAEVKIFAGNFAPRGWAFCDGQLLPIAQNTALFSLIGTTFGGDGRTTIALPNLQDRAAMHPGRGPGLTARRLGQSGGAAEETLSEAQLPAHTHAPQASTIAADQSSPNTSRVLASAKIYGDATDLVEMASNNVGSGQAHNNKQPYLGLNFIIALTGLFPSRS